MKFLLLALILPLGIIAAQNRLGPDDQADLDQPDLEDSMFGLFDMVDDDQDQMLDMIRNGDIYQRGMAPCPISCKFDYTPVCGSDGKTYSNKCELAVEACKKRIELSVAKQGEC